MPDARLPQPDPEVARQELLVRHALGETTGEEKAQAERLLANDARARREFDENLAMRDLMERSRPEGAPAPLPAGLDRPSRKETTRDSLLTWRTTLPAAGLAGLILGAGVWWALDQSQQSPPPEPPLAFTPPPSSPAVQHTPSPAPPEKDKIWVTLEAAPLPALEIVVAQEPSDREILIRPGPVNDPLISLIEPAAPTPVSEAVPAAPAESRPSRPEPKRVSTMDAPLYDREIREQARRNDASNSREGAGSSSTATEKLPTRPGSTSPADGKESAPPRSKAPPNSTARPQQMQPVKKETPVGFFVPKLPDPKRSTVANSPAAQTRAPEQESVSTAAPPVEEPPVIQQEGLVAQDFSPPHNDAPPFRLITERIDSPFTPGRQLLMVGIKAVKPGLLQRLPSNLVFLVDNTDSMQPAERLPLIKDALGTFFDQLTPLDRVAFVTYGGTTIKHLSSTPSTDRASLFRALDELVTRPTKSSGPALNIAYDVARANFIRDGVNRVIVVTDGDWNFGFRKGDGLFEYVDNQARNGISLSVIGVGKDFLKDTSWKSLARLGRGTFARVSTRPGAVQAFQLQTQRQAPTGARNVRVELALDPAQVKSYRLLGYQNQWTPSGDANNDERHILAFYEIEQADNATFDPAPLVQVDYLTEPGDKPAAVAGRLPIATTPVEKISQELRKALARAEELAKE